MGFPYTAKGLERFCRLLTIDDQGPGGRIPFAVNGEQREVLKSIAAHQMVYIVKPRQVGLSTVVKAVDNAWAIERDIANKPAECALIWDDMGKVRSHIASMAEMLDGIGAPHKHLARGEIRFPNGTLIKGYTAGGANPGRGMALKRIHASEPPFWKSDPSRVWAGIRNGLGVGHDVSITIETTMDPTVPFAMDMWDNQENGFHKVFLPVSLHVAYRDWERAETLTDDEIAFLHEEGFIDESGVMTPELRASGAWWLLKLEELGSLTWLKRDYPQKIEHCFAQDFGRWVLADPILIRPTEILYVPGLDGEALWELELFVHPEDVEGRCVISVDTSEGAGLDRSAIVVVDSATGRVCGSFASEWCAYDDLACVAVRFAEHFRIGAGAGKRSPRDRDPEIVVEKNGVGFSTLRELNKAGWGPIPFLATAETKYRGLLHAKREIESGRAYGPQCLLDDARSCNKDGGVWKGRKDVLSALGFAHCWLEGDKDPVAKEDKGEVWARYQELLAMEEGDDDW